MPKLRFKDEDGKKFAEWECSTIGEKVNEKSSKFNPEKHTDNLKCIELEHLSQNTGELLGYVDASNSKSIKNKFEAGDVLFGKLRPYLRKYLKAPFAGVCSTEIWVLKGKEISNNFLFQFVQTERFITQANISSGSKMPRADWNVVSSAIAYFPSSPEQTKVANFLTAIDEKITQLTQKYDLLKQYKKGVMQQIFSHSKERSDCTETYPRGISQKLRFKDEDGREFPEWEEKSFGEIADIQRGASPRPITDKRWFSDKSNIGWVRISDVTKSSKYLNVTDQYLSSEGIEKSRYVPKGHIIMSICATIGKPIYTNLDVCIHDGFVVFKNFKANHEFFYYYLQLTEDKWYQYGQLGSQVNLNTAIVSNETIFLPCTKEQTKIAHFLTAIDDKITHAQTQLAAVKQYKQGLLQQMFV
ncbi:MAG: restriction endonuclease subunit S [Nitrosomonas sp.]|nr:restriction endonuclease subunit S [Nitrosomonas sp.]MDP1951177.1 restriction endonuclease subunit S [Nitrosomonas sp.]